MPLAPIFLHHSAKMSVSYYQFAAFALWRVFLYASLFHGVHRVLQFFGLWRPILLVWRRWDGGWDGRMEEEEGEERRWGEEGRGILYSSVWRWLCEAARWIRVLLGECLRELGGWE